MNKLTKSCVSLLEFCLKTCILYSYCIQLMICYLHYALHKEITHFIWCITSSFRKLSCFSICSFTQCLELTLWFPNIETVDWNTLIYQQINLKRLICLWKSMIVPVFFISMFPSFRINLVILISWSISDQENLRNVFHLIDSLKTDFNSLMLYSSIDFYFTQKFK